MKYMQTCNMDESNKGVGERELTIGGRYHFSGQSERLIYLGYNFSSNGYWHQFALADNPTVVWSEILPSDLYMIEETNEINS